MTELVGYMLLFVVVAVAFVFVHLVAGKFIRPVKPDPEKLTIYECGEPTIGSSWIQFDLRFYVVALLFVIFDVEVAFFFPWAVVFGKVNQLADKNLPEPQRVAITRELVLVENPAAQPQIKADEAVQLGWLAFFDLLVFFGVLIGAAIAVVTLVGMFVGFSTFFLWVIAVYAAQPIVGALLGQWILGRTTHTWPLIGRMLVGLFLIRVCTLLPHGWILKVVVTLWGLGAISLALYRRFQPASPAQAPSVPPSAPLTPLTPAV